MSSALKPVSRIWRKKEIICVGTTLYKIVNRDCHYSTLRGIGRYLLHGKQNTAGKILIFWWNDESIYKHKEKQQLTSSSTFQQEKRKDTPHSTSLFFWLAVWWNDDECISFWLSVYYPVISSIHRIFIHQQVCRTNGWKEIPLSASWSVGHPTCLLSDQPTREGVSYRRQERSAYTGGTLTGFWEQKSHSSLGHFLYAVQAQLKMTQWANGVTPLWTPPLAMRHDCSRREPTNQIVKPEIEKQAWDI